MTVLRQITVISGGQTGADRAALDFAIASGIMHGGWCPRNRRAEDGIIPPQYLLQETPSGHYSQRTQWNVRDGDATAIFTIRPRVSGGTRLTLELAQRLGKPIVHLSRDELGVEEAATKLIAFLEAHAVQALNVAGPRASQEPEIGAFVNAVLAAVFKGC